MDDDLSNSLRRMSTRARKVAPKMAAALASADNRTQAILARLEALENDNPGAEIVEPNEDEDASLDEDDEQVFHKKHSKGTKRKTRQAKALETAKKAPRTFLELLHDANLESLPPHVPSYLRAAVGPPSSTCRRHFCTVCGFAAKYTCAIGNMEDKMLGLMSATIINLLYHNGMIVSTKKEGGFTKIDTLKRKEGKSCMKDGDDPPGLGINWPHMLVASKGPRKSPL
ncbi:hypothetical protein E3N88_08979 [Mikania micrantha]|uniref:Uncharacterized protein n=1 Tax=Mikania micrantha TaxID=192012 RepID=A0A5N6PK30_9ASTR|nr:hypothetical protein E3N88_08979 [Mikania micrantha]